MSTPLREWVPSTLRMVLRAAWGMDVISRALMWDPRGSEVHVTPGLLVLLEVGPGDVGGLTNQLRLALLALARVMDDTAAHEVKRYEQTHGAGSALSVLDTDAGFQAGLVRAVAQVWLAHIRHILKPHAFALLRMLVHICFGRSAEAVRTDLASVLPASMPPHLASLLRVHIAGVCSMEGLLRTLLRCSWYAVSQLRATGVYAVTAAGVAPMDPAVPFSLPRWLGSPPVTSCTYAAEKHLAVQPASGLELKRGAGAVVLSPPLHKSVAKHLPAATAPSDRDLVMATAAALGGKDTLTREEVAVLAHTADLLLQHFLSATPAPTYHDVEMMYIHRQHELAALEGVLLTLPRPLVSAVAAAPTPMPAAAPKAAPAPKAMLEMLQVPETYEMPDEREVAPPPQRRHSRLASQRGRGPLLRHRSRSTTTIDEEATEEEAADSDVKKAALGSAAHAQSTRRTSNAATHSSSQAATTSATPFASAVNGGVPLPSPILYAVMDRGGTQSTYKVRVCMSSAEATKLGLPVPSSTTTMDEFMARQVAADAWLQQQVRVHYDELSEQVRASRTQPSMRRALDATTMRSSFAPPSTTSEDDWQLCEEVLAASARDRKRRRAVVEAAKGASPAVADAATLPHTAFSARNAAADAVHALASDAAGMSKRPRRGLAVAAPEVLTPVMQEQPQAATALSLASLGSAPARASPPSPTFDDAAVVRPARRSKQVREVTKL